jgi:hypothetical protein
MGKLNRYLKDALQPFARYEKVNNICEYELEHSQRFISIQRGMKGNWKSSKMIEE